MGVYWTTLVVPDMLITQAATCPRYDSPEHVYAPTTRIHSELIHRHSVHDHGVDPPCFVLPHAQDIRLESLDIRPAHSQPFEGIGTHLEPVEVFPELLSNLRGDEIDETIFSNSLSTSDMPDPDLLIRTSGECRLSNFLLWQSAYTEIFMTETFWPAFREDALMEAVLDFQSRERRFGKVSEQVNN